jgi:hypothetical protein
MRALPSIRRLRRRRGMDMVQALFYLVLVAVALAGAAFMFSQGMGNQKAADAQRQLQATVAAIRNVYVYGSGYPTTATNFATALINANQIPQDMIVRTPAISLRNAFGGAIVSTGLAAGGFTIAVEDVPAAACQKMVMSTLDAWRVAVAPVGGGTGGNYTPGVDTQDAAVTLCSGNGSNLFDLTYSFR